MAINKPLLIGACLSFIAALLHIACIIGGPDWYLFMGAGQHMADLAAADDPHPTIVTSFIAGVLIVWGLYALSGVGIIIKLPLLKTALVLITTLYLIRGAAGLVLPHLTESPIVHQNSMTFWLISSVICCVYGAFYFLGSKQLFTSTKNNRNNI